MVDAARTSDGEKASGSVKEAGKLSLKEASEREQLVEVCRRCIEHAYRRLTNKYTLVAEQTKLYHAVARLVVAETAVLRDVELDMLRVEIERLKEIVKP
jgi:2C-methyl-D-erythritol 2,4-cyclodiphosphate synthase